MTPPAHDWSPEPELLSAYGDGELGDRPELAQRVEAWLAAHPEAHADLEAQQRLRELWHDTAPADPGAERWQPMLTRLHQARTAAPPAPRSAWPRLVALAALAAAACVTLLIWTAAQQPGAPVGPILLPEEIAEGEILPVATADEVVVLRIEGDDTGTLVVGQLPLSGPMVLAETGEIEQISSEPDARDQMIPQFRLRGRPMIWARLDTDD
jgi:hypothetical protein